MIVRLRQPSREVEVRGDRPARAVLIELGFAPESYIVICNGTLVPSDTVLHESDSVELRPVISGG
ncbi:MAG: MoaD/ThiS family protein [Ilumatobacteraceae bacterium]|nr:thiamine biosynthesis protein ThiS [Actinomycetota bacterium]